MVVVPPLPTPSSSYAAGDYAALVIDPDGNNIEAILREG